MEKILIALLTAFALVGTTLYVVNQSSTSSSDFNNWVEWKSKNNKHYSSPVEEAKKFQTW